MADEIAAPTAAAAKAVAGIATAGVVQRVLSGGIGGQHPPKQGATNSV